MDPEYNLLIADYSKNVIRKVFLYSGIIETFAGTGIGGYNSDNIAATAAKLNAPYNIATDANGNVYIADTLNNRIRMVQITIFTLLVAMDVKFAMAFVARS